MDFTTPHVIGERIAQVTGGYDHNFVLDMNRGNWDRQHRSTIREREGLWRCMSTQPGVQFYSGNFLDGTITGKGGQSLSEELRFCLETQHFPDSPNQPSFPNTILRPGEKFQETTVWKFGVK